MSMRTVRASAKEVRSHWADRELTLRQAAAALGMSVDALQARAVAMKLPPRKGGRREVIRPRQEGEFRAMWRAGVSAREIAQHYSCSYFAVVNTAARLGLPARGTGFRPKLTRAKYLEVRLAVAMSALAASERAGVQ